MPAISIITASVREKGIPIVEKHLRAQTFRDFEHIIQRREGTMEGNYWTLNQDMNIALRKAQGELIVSIQDWTAFKPDALEKFWAHYQINKRSCVTGWGDKYTNDQWLVKTWQDPRNTDSTFREVPFHWIEGNFCAIPKQAFYDVGGFDEYLDKYAGMDFYSVLDRLDMNGWKFYLDGTNESFSLEHGRLPNWEEKNAIYGAYNERRKAYVANTPLQYLS